MTILVTGGAGFIGANFVYYLLKEHPAERVVCVALPTQETCLHWMQHANNRILYFTKKTSAIVPPFLKFLSRNIQILL